MQNQGYLAAHPCSRVPRDGHGRRYVPNVIVARLQNLLELLLLVGRQGRGELHAVLDNEVAPLTGLLRDGHAEVGV